MDTLHSQVSAFLVTIAAGFSLGLLFDIYRVIRGAVRPRHFLNHVMDVVFWVIAAPLVLVELLLANWLELRFYVFLGLFLGLFLYFAVFSPVVIGMLLILGRGAAQLVGLAFHGLTLAFLLPANLIRTLTWRLGLRRRLPSLTGWKVMAGVRWRSGWLSRLLRRFGR